MNDGDTGPMVTRFRSASRLAASVTIALGTLVLIGWLLDIAFLKSVYANFVTMKANAALCFLLLGVSLWIFHLEDGASIRKRLVTLSAAVPVVIAGVTLLESAMGMQSGIDNMLFSDIPGALHTSFPSRMAPTDAINFLLLGVAMLFAGMPKTERLHPTEILAASAFIIALFPFTGYAYGVSALIGYSERFTEMSIHASLGFMILSVGILFSRPDGGWASLATKTGEAGFLLRVILPLIIIALFIMGWMRLLGESLGLFGSQFGTALFVVLRIVLIGSIIIWAARMIYRIERNRLAIQEELERTNASLGRRVAERTAEIESAKEELLRQNDLLSKITESGGVLIILLDREGRIVRFNRASEETTGYHAEEVMNHVFWELFPRHLTEEMPESVFQPVFEKGETVAGESAWKTREGETRWVRWSGTGLISYSGSINHCVITGIDVTDRRRAEERVWQNEERLRAIMDHVPVGVILTSGLGQKVIYQNPCFLDFFGYTLDDIPDVASWWPLAYPDREYRAVAMEVWNKRISEAALFQSDIEPMQAYITAKDGTAKNMSIHATVLGDMTFITFIDLTERQRAENARRLDEMRLEALVKLNQMTRSSLKELTDFVLEEAVRLTGSTIGYLAFTSDEESVLNMYSWSKTAMQQCAIQDKPIVYPVIETGLWGEAVRQRVPVITNDYTAPNPLKKGYPEGHVPVLRHMNIPVMDEDHIVAVAGVGNKEEPYDDADVRQLTLLMEGMWRILQRRKTEEEVKRTKAYLQNVVDSMPSVLVGVDLQGHITHWNSEASRFTRLSADELHGKEIGDAFPQIDVHLEKIREAIHEGNPLETERFTTRNEQDDNRIYDVMVFPLIANGAQGAVVRIDDVTSRVQIEEMMVQTEKMMSVGGLAAGMAHEINNPLGGILQACQNIERRTSPDLPKNEEVAKSLGIELEHVRRYLQERGILEFITGIRADGTRAARIVADMLAFSRRSESKFSPTDLVDVVDTVLRLAANDYDLKKQYDFRSVNIVRDFEEDLPLVPCDKTKIEQVLLNLVKNAAQAMATGHGNSRPEISIHLHKEAHHLRIEVQDNGPGMDESVRRRVFEPFFTTKEVGVGTGLGLSVSYFIITRQHKGTMTVDSAPGTGTRFIIQLPLQAKG